MRIMEQLGLEVRNSVRRKCTSLHNLIQQSKVLSTGDDCIHEANIRQMHDLIRERGYTATFFPVSRFMHYHDPQLWRDIVNSGSEIGYHTTQHTPSMSVDELNADYHAFVEDVRHVLGDPGYTVRYVRPPEGAWDANWEQWAASRSLVTVRWNIVPPVDSVYIDGILRHDNGGGIVLLHTTLEDIAWLERIFPELEALRDSAGRPYTITSLSRAFND
ncbi:MAG: polysaccharide deacetylase family protein [Chloroflexota bacterium]